jgi:UDP-GlcNAc:undecaprenyl-phosphate GlcNAc-1-phosphate transferase
VNTAAGFAALAVVTAALAYLLSPFAAKVALWCGAVDMPDARKIHSRPMPRLGGLAVIAAVALALWGARMLGGAAWGLPGPLLRGLVLGLLPVVGVSLVDDVRSVPARIKFACHLAGAVVAVAAGVSLQAQVHVLGYRVSIGFLAAPLSVLWIAGVTNAFNIIDGLDGLAAGLALIAALAMSGVFFAVGQSASALLPVALAGALAGFLPYNLYPARMFLGDTGATAIGFCLAAVALRGGSTMSAGFAAAMPVLLMGLPIADTVIAVCRRLVRRAERAAGGVFVPDRNHVHHRLLALGLSQRRAVFVLYATGAVAATIAFVSLFVSQREAALLLLSLAISAVIGLKRLGYDEFALLRRGTFLRLYEVPVLRRTAFVAFVDIGFVVLSAYLAVGLKTDDWLLVSSRRFAFELSLFLAPVSALVFWRARMYEGSWRLATIDDYARAVLANAAVAAVALVLLAWQWQSAPASLVVVYALLSTTLTVGARAGYRVLVSAQQRLGRTGRPVLLFGPGPEDLVAARDFIGRAIATGMRPVGLISDYPVFRGRLVEGLKVLGTSDDLARVSARAGATTLLVDREPAPGLVALCETAGLALCRFNVAFQEIIAAGLNSTAADVPPRERSTGEPCPRCGHLSLRRSRTRSSEILRRRLDSRRPYRCHECGWRGWRHPLMLPETVAPASSSGLDLATLD